MGIPNQIACICAPTELLLPTGSNERAPEVLTRLGVDTSHDFRMKVALSGRAGVSSGMNATSHFDEEGKMLLAFTGAIENHATLASSYLDGREGVTSAELVCAMYRALPPRQVAAKLRGDWALVGYDIRQERAFGARSGENSTIPLFQGKLANGTVVLSTFKMTRETSRNSHSFEWERNLLEIPPSHYVFGWRKLQFPLLYTASPDDPSQAQVVCAVRQALIGMPTEQLTATRILSEPSGMWKRDVPISANLDFSTPTPPSTPPSLVKARFMKQARIHIAGNTNVQRHSIKALSADASPYVPTPHENTQLTNKHRSPTTSSHKRRPSARGRNNNPAPNRSTPRAVTATVAEENKSNKRFASSRLQIEEVVSTLHRIASGILLPEVCKESDCSVQERTNVELPSRPRTRQGRVSHPRRANQASQTRLVTI